MKYVMYSLVGLGLALALWRTQFDRSGQPPLLIADTHLAPSPYAGRAHPAGTVPFGGEPATPSAPAAELYTAHCAHCHGNNGNGHSYVSHYPGMPAVGNLQTSERSAGELRLIIDDGRGAMPAHRHRLRTPDRAALTDYIITTLHHQQQP